MNDSTEKKHEGNSSKRRKLSTINYIHKTFFEEGHDSDIKIVALNREWNLHKNFLSQSPYFKSMFSGSWVEKKLKEINLEIEDVNITSEALHKVFESLYSDEIQIEPTEVVPILACASFFQLDDLIKHCAKVMKSCINKFSEAVRFFEAAELYSVEEVKNVAFDWLCRCVYLCVYRAPLQLLNMISEDLMKKLLISPDLCVPGEKDAFLILTAWVFLKENNVDFACESVTDILKHPRLFQYFTTYVKEKTFLETDSGISYQSLFRALRLKDLILYFEHFEKWNIIPMEWMMPIFKTQWYHMSKIHRGLDKGPKSVSEDIFNKECVRISGRITQNRVVTKDKYFDFGFGFAFSHDDGRFKIKRNLSSEINSNSSEGPASSNTDKRYLMYRVSLFYEDSVGRVLDKAETGIETVSMAPKEEIEVLTFTPLNNCVLLCRINLLFTTP